MKLHKVCSQGFMKLNTNKIKYSRISMAQHRWLIYHGYFKLVLESLGKNHTVADIIIFSIIYDDFF